MRTDPIPVSGDSEGTGVLRQIQTKKRDVNLFFLSLPHLLLYSVCNLFFMLQFWRNYKFREVEINPEHHAFAQARWDAWIHSPEYGKIFRQYFREYDGQQLAGDHDFDDWNYQQFVRSAAYNQALAGWVWCRKYDEEKERQKLEKQHNEYMQWFDSILREGTYTKFLFEPSNSDDPQRTWRAIANQDGEWLDNWLNEKWKFLGAEYHWEERRAEVSYISGRDWSMDELKQTITEWFYWAGPYFSQRLRNR